MEQAPGVKEVARAEAGGCATSRARSAEERDFLKKTRAQVQEGSAGKSELAPEDFAYV